MGDVADFRNFMGAVIDRRAFTRIGEHLERARTDPRVKIVAGGGADDSVGFFVQPTLLQAEDPNYRTMCEEIFGPVLTVHVYPAARWTRDARAGGRDQPLRAHRRGLRPRPRGAGRGRPGAAERRGQLLHQRQADRRGGRASSRSAVPAPAAPTTRRARSSTCCAGSRLGASRRRSCRRRTTATRSWRRHRLAAAPSDALPSSPARARSPRRRRTSRRPGSFRHPALFTTRPAARLRHLPRNLPRPARDPDRCPAPARDAHPRRRAAGTRASLPAPAIALEAWYDSLALSRESPETKLSPDTDGLLGGRYRGRLRSDRPLYGAWPARSSPTRSRRWPMWAARSTTCCRRCRQGAGRRETVVESGAALELHRLPDSLAERRVVQRLELSRQDGGPPGQRPGRHRRRSRHGRSPWNKDGWIGMRGRDCCAASGTWWWRPACPPAARVPQPVRTRLEQDVRLERVSRARADCR